MTPRVVYRTPVLTKLLLVVAVAVVVLLVATTAGDGALAPSVVDLIDHVRLVNSIDVGTNVTNYIFRGGIPEFDNETFAYDALVSSMEIALAEATNGTGKLPQQFYLIDVSLLNELQESGQISAERDFFEKYPDLGELMWWPIYGSLLNPSDFPETILRTLSQGYNDWSHDKVDDGLNTIQTQFLALNSRGISTVFYIHCDAGMDRTGEVSGSYYVRYMNWTFQEALYYDNHDIESRDIHTGSRNEFQWYCYYLFYTEQLTKGYNCSLPSYY